jgi:hypothetical protein
LGASDSSNEEDSDSGNEEESKNQVILVRKAKGKPTSAGSLSPRDQGSFEHLSESSKRLPASGKVGKQKSAPIVAAAEKRSTCSKARETQPSVFPQQNSKAIKKPKEASAKRARFANSLSLTSVVSSVSLALPGSRDLDGEEALTHIGEKHLSHHLEQFT